MVWPKRVLYVAKTLSANASLLEYQELYTRLFHHLARDHPYTFLCRTRFEQWGFNDTWDRVPYYELQYKYEPVFMLQLRDPSQLSSPLKRASADYHLRLHIADLAKRSPVVPLRGVSAMGSQLAFYAHNIDNKETVPTAAPTLTVDNTPPVDRWSIDVLSTDGEREFRRMVKKIRRELSHPHEEEET